MLSTVEGHLLLGNEPTNTYSWQRNMVFSIGFVPKNYKRAQSEELEEYGGVQRSMKEYKGLWRSTME
jgi:hypothetical protein